MPRSQAPPLLSILGTVPCNKFFVIIQRKNKLGIPRLSRAVDRHLWHWRGPWLLAPMVAATVWGLRCLGALQGLEWAAYDLGMQWRQAEGIDRRIVIVEVTEKDLQQTQQWPLSGKVLADLLNRIKRGQPAAIGLDIYRDFPVEPGHKALTDVFKTTPNLIGIQKLIANEGGSGISPPAELAERDQVGSNDLLLDADGRLRRALLFQPVGGIEQESFSLRLADLYLAQQGIEPDLEAPVLTWQGKSFPPFEQNDGGYVRANASAHQILLNYRSGAVPFEKVSMGAVMAGQVPSDRFQNRVVMIGTTAASLKDRFLTPLSQNQRKFSILMPGIEVHAHGVSQILATVLDGRSLLRVWPEPAEFAWVVLWSSLGAGLTWGWRRGRVGWLGRGLLGVGLGFGMLGVGLAALSWGWWVPVVPGLVAYGGASMAVTAYMAKNAAGIRRIFGRYLSDAVVTQLLESPEGLKLGGERRFVTVLMSDLRGFTAASAQCPPEMVLAFLNEYLAVMTEVIAYYEGTIDEFLGDSILVIFGAPTRHVDDSDRAVACALAMQRAMNQVYQRTAHLHLPPIEMGIGIHSGESVVGNIGSTKRAKYGLVGSAINLTSRIESYSVGGEVLISEATRDAVSVMLQLRHHVQLQAKGFAEAIEVYSVEGMGAPYDLSLPKEDEAMQVLPEVIPVVISILAGKHSEGAGGLGVLMEISERQAVVQSPMDLARFSNITLSIEGLDLIYGKVIDRSTQRDCYLVRFTFLPDGALLWLRRLDLF